MTQKGKSDKDNINRAAMTNEKRKYRILQRPRINKAKNKTKNLELYFKNLLSRG